MVRRLSSGPLKGLLMAVLTLRHAAKENRAGSRIALVGTDQIFTAGVLLAELRDALADYGPEYMVPTTWIVVQRMPLTASGKLSRVAVKSWLDRLDSKTYTRVNEAMVTEETTRNWK
jgi:acyl-coenzyme A synthetase/AMP-(fatty) acid ligase